MINCDNCRYDGMCIRQSHTMANVDDCNRYEEYKEIPHGEWIPKTFSTLKCSKCEFEFNFMRCDFYLNMFFCPSCGADMRKRGKAE